MITYFLTCGRYVGEEGPPEGWGVGQVGGLADLGGQGDTLWVSTLEAGEQGGLKCHEFA